MKKGSLALALVALIATAAPAARAQTQLDLDIKSCNDFASADKRLNAAYQKVLAANAKDAVFTAKFRAAQRAWVAFRDAELEALYPAKDKRLEYGSVYPMCDCEERADLTIKRAEQLEGWLNAQEGDVCTGSRSMAGR